MLIYNEKQFASIGENFHDLTTVFFQEITYVKLFDSTCQREYFSIIHTNYR